jgi:hypothetical protein
LKSATLSSTVAAGRVSPEGPLADVAARADGAAMAPPTTLAHMTSMALSRTDARNNMGKPAPERMQPSLPMLGPRVKPGAGRRGRSRAWSRVQAMAGRRTAVAFAVEQKVAG